MCTAGTSSEWALLYTSLFLFHGFNVAKFITLIGVLSLNVIRHSGVQNN